MQWNLAALETLMAEDQMDRHAFVLRGFSVVELWRLRRVCRAFHRWGTAALAALPRPVAVGGNTGPREEDDATASVEVLDLSTLRWSSGVVPALPPEYGSGWLQGIEWHAACCLDDGRVVVVGGASVDPGGSHDRKALQWVPGGGAAPLPIGGIGPEAVTPLLPVDWESAIDPKSGNEYYWKTTGPCEEEATWERPAGWAPLPDMAEGRESHAAVALPDGRAMVIGGSYLSYRPINEDEDEVRRVCCGAHGFNRN